jgi:hypothetical protein
MVNTLPLPLALLAGVAHPERAVRRRIVERLDRCIENEEPIYPEHRLQRFFARTIGDPEDMGEVGTAVQEIAVRVFRLTFARDTRPWKLWLRLEGVGLAAHKDALYVDRWLKVLPVKGVRFSGGRFCPLLRVCRLAIDELKERLMLVETPSRPVPVHAVCRFARADGGFCLRLGGDLPQFVKPQVTILRTGQCLAFEAKRWPKEGVLELRPTSAEAVIVFSAALVRKEALKVLDRGRPAGCRWVVVGLRDFDGEEVHLPALAGPPPAESWLSLEYPVPLPDRDRVAVLRWCYPDSDWLTDGLLEMLA